MISDQMILIMIVTDICEFIGHVVLTCIMKWKYIVGNKETKYCHHIQKMAESHNDCAPYPAEVKEVLEKGPKGPDGKPLTKIIDYFSSKDPHYVVEIRPAKRSQGKEIGLINETCKDIEYNACDNR